jgi:glycosyltransferase involved in cell wall biosynthesis
MEQSVHDNMKNSHLPSRTQFHCRQVAMNIAICVPLDLNNHGGVEKHIFSLAHALRQLGLRVDVFGNATPHPENASRYNFLHLKTLNPQRYHIVHTHSGLISMNLVKVLLNRYRCCRHVHTIHNFALGYLFACRTWLNWRCYSSTLVEAAWCHRADHVIAVSDYVRDNSLKLFRISPRKITTILNGFTADHLSPDTRSRTRKRLGIEDRHIALLFIGRSADRVKGAATVTATMKQLHKHLPALKLIAIPGDGFEPAPWIIRTGPVHHHAIMDYYAASDIFVNASLNEGLPLTIVEAMAAQLPIVAAPVGGIPEIITHNQNGLLLNHDRSDLAEQLTRLINDPPLRQKLAQNAKLSAQPLTWQKIAQQTLNVYEAVI